MKKKLSVTTTYVQQAEGYRVGNLDQIDSRFKCGNCDLILRFPMIAECGHRYCFGCLEANTPNQCKLCLTNSFTNIFNFTYMKNAVFHADLTIQTEISELKKIQCPFVEYGCEEKMDFVDLDNHILKCMFRVVPCRKCKEKVCQVRINDHEKSDCQCSYECNSKVPLSTSCLHISTNSSTYRTNYNRLFSVSSNYTSMVSIISKSEWKAVCDYTICKFCNGKILTGELDSHESQEKRFYYSLYLHLVHHGTLEERKLLETHIMSLSRQFWFETLHPLAWCPFGCKKLRKHERSWKEHINHHFTRSTDMLLMDCKRLETSITVSDTTVENHEMSHMETHIEEPLRQNFSTSDSFVSKQRNKFQTSLSWKHKLKAGGDAVGNLEEVSDCYKCTYCKQILKDPMQSQCGHRFCSDCVQNVSVKHQKCSGCLEENELDAEVVTADRCYIDYATRRDISRNLKNLLCPYYKLGCSEKLMSLEDLAEHSAECGLRKVKCKACGKNVKRKYQVKHLTDGCSLTTAKPCRICQKLVEKDVVAQYLHLKNECKLDIVNRKSCPYGCKIVRKCSMKKHLNHKHVTLHLDKMFSRLEDMLKSKPFMCKHLPCYYSTKTTVPESRRHGCDNKHERPWNTKVTKQLQKYWHFNKVAHTVRHMEMFVLKHCKVAEERSTKRSKSKSIGGYKVGNLDEIDSGYKCEYCHLILRDPKQTYCGRRFCSDCWKVVDTTNKDGLVDLDLIFSDKAILKDLKQQNGFLCPHSMLGCRELMTYRELEESAAEWESHGITITPAYARILKEKSDSTNDSINSRLN